MGLLDFLIRKRAKPARRRKSKRRDIFGQQIAGIQCQLISINNVLQKHRKDIVENSALLKEHSQKLKNLEDILANQPTNLLPSQISPTERPERTTKPAQSNSTNGCKFDIDNFSSQEKKILSVFFSHQDMVLSYRDVASILNKSVNTIKNQMQQIRLKADLFDWTIGDQQQNRFKLKDNLKVEKYLQLN